MQMELWVKRRRTELALDDVDEMLEFRFVFAADVRRGLGGVAVEHYGFWGAVLEGFSVLSSLGLLSVRLMTRGALLVYVVRRRRLYSMYVA
jgi:hypothetical protein